MRTSGLEAPSQDHTGALEGPFAVRGMVPFRASKSGESGFCVTQILFTLVSKTVQEQYGTKQ